LAFPQFWSDSWRPYLRSSNSVAVGPDSGERSASDVLCKAQSLLTAHDFFRKDFPYAVEREAAIAQLLRYRRTFCLSPPTYHAAVTLFDAVCGSRRVRASHLPGIAEVCLYLSIKANESVLKVAKQDEFQSKMNSDLGKEAFRQLEISVAAFLNFRFLPTTPHSVYSLLASVGYVSPADTETLGIPALDVTDFIDKMDRMCLLMIELSCRWYSFNQFPPTAVAVACIQLVREDCGMTSSTPELERLTNVASDTSAACITELRKLLRFYRSQFPRRLPGVLTRWIRPDLVVQTHRESILTFLSEFIPCHQLSKNIRPKKKIHKLGADRQKQLAAGECRKDTAIKKRPSVLSMWDYFLQQIDMATQEYPFSGQHADTKIN